MTAVIAHRARDDPFFKDRHITGQLLGVPLLVHHDAHPDKYVTTSYCGTVPVTDESDGS